MYELPTTSLPTTSFSHIEEKTESPISSTSQIATEQNIFAKYREIKKKNEALKATTYSKFWKKISTTQHRLLSSLDTEKGQIQLAFLELTVPIPKGIEDYKSSVFSFDTKKIHVIDHIDLRKQTGEMI